MAGQGGPLRQFPPPLPVDPWAALLASLPQSGTPPLPQLPTSTPFDSAPIAIMPEPTTPGARLKAATEHATNPFADEWMKR